MKLTCLVFLVALSWTGCNSGKSETDRSVDRPNDMLTALDSFQTYVNERWSYRFANGADYEVPIGNLREKIKAGLTMDEFGVEIEKIVALGLDGHSRVRGYNWPAGGCLPFLVEAEGDHFIAIYPDRKAFLLNDFPYLTEIDGKSIEEWCSYISTRVPKGAPHWVRHRCLVRFLGRLDYWREVMSLPKSDSVVVELTNASGEEFKKVKLSVSKSPQSFGVWPKSSSSLLKGNIGYIRLSNMQKESSLNEINLWMPKFRNAEGLIIDVRDNDGGDRDALNLIYGYLASPADPPRVFTAAAYRLHSSRKSNHLAGAHFMFTDDYEKWTLEDKTAINAFKTMFNPEWQLPAGQFSEWHYMVLHRHAEPKIYHFDKPVVVLMNAKCFSATDIFLAGLKGMKNVTLLGSPSGGGSGASETYKLGATDITVTLSSMASFKSNGELFDGNGVLPDKILYHVPEYFIGLRDNVLDEALKIITNKNTP